MRLGIGKWNLGRKFLLITLFVCIVFVIYSFLHRLEPAYNSHFSALANNVVNEIASNTVSDVFKNEEFNIFTQTQNTSENRVTAINTDTAKINRLKSQIILNLNEKIKNYIPQKVEIPLMSASGFGVLSGAGPKIPITISPVSLINSDFKENFTGAGINCVKYTLGLDITIDVRCSGFLYSISEPVNTEIIIIDTIISGDIPNYYGTEVGLVGEE